MILEVFAFMTLLQLLYFDTLARVLHYTQAAKELHISQPSLSYAMKELEKELHVELFTRKNRKMILTPYGQRFLPYVQKALQILDNSKSALAEMTDAAEHVVSLGYFHSIAESFIPPLIESFYKIPSQRSIQFQFQEGTACEIFSQVKNGELDLGFTTFRDDNVYACLVMQQPLYLVVPLEHPLAKKNAVTFQDFAHESLVALTKGNSLRQQMDQVFAKQDIIPKIVFEVQGCDAALRYIDLKFGVGILPEIPAFKSSRVVALPIADRGTEFIRNVYLIWDAVRILSPSMEKVKDFIVSNYSLNQQD